MNKMRIDKWLWAARFFKTRTLAKQAIDGGKIHCDGQRVKASKDITPNQLLRIRQGWDTKEVVVTALSDRRRDASTAATLYRETEASIHKRQLLAAQRKQLKGETGGQQTAGRPTKKQRRQIHRFKDMTDQL
ncbi:MAG: RNA-binding protein [Cellvibrionaceae bacterium]|nr:RNA-binding protein [Cellvibrionaceae bacterium]